MGHIKEEGYRIIYLSHLKVFGVEYVKLIIIGIVFYVEVCTGGVHVYYNDDSVLLERSLVGDYKQDDIEEVWYLQGVRSESHLLGKQC